MPVLYVTTLLTSSLLFVIVEKPISLQPAATTIYSLQSRFRLSQQTQVATKSKPDAKPRTNVDLLHNSVVADLVKVGPRSFPYLAELSEHEPNRGPAQEGQS